MPKAATKQYLVPAIKRCFDLIDLLAEHSKGLTVSEIHRSLHLPLSSTAAILYTLQALGLLEKDTDSARYTLGTKITHYSNRLNDQLDVVGRCHALLEQLAQESGLTSHIAVMRESESVYIDRVPGSGLIQISSYVGMRWPLHSSGVGKVLLAFMPEEELLQTLKYLPMSRLTQSTVTVRHMLEKELKKYRQLGYAWEMNEGELGVACIAAPIFGKGNVALAAISISGTTYQISEERLPALGALIKKYAALMSDRMGYDSVS